MELMNRLLDEALRTIQDILPMVLIFIVFQAVVMGRYPPRLRSILVGLGHVFVGLTLFRVGLSDSLLPIGSLMAGQLTDPEFVTARGVSGWDQYLWLYAFAALIGFTATLIEPTLIAVAERVGDLTGGALHPWALRLVVSVGVAAGLLLGALRIVLGIPLEYFLVPLLAMMVLLAFTAPRAIVPLALDSGGMATSVVTVPMIAAFGVALAEALPDRNPLADGFGLIVLALLLPVVSLLFFSQLQDWRRRALQSGGKNAV